MTRRLVVRVQDVENIWGYRRALYIESPDGSLAAAYDSLGNCLGGSCEEVERVLSRVREECVEEGSRVLRDFVGEYFAERTVEYSYICEDGS